MAKLMAEDMEMEYLSAGQVFRKMAEESGLSLEEFSKRAEVDESIDRRVDDYQVEMGRGKDVVVDSRLGAFLFEDADLRICLMAPLDVRARRIAGRDGISDEDSRERILDRERSERTRYREIYGIDINDFHVYDLILNSATYLPGQALEIVCRALDVTDGSQEQ